jgi:hypothetical protein
MLGDHTPPNRTLERTAKRRHRLIPVTLRMLTAVHLER